MPPWLTHVSFALPWLADPLLSAGTLTRMTAAIAVGAVPLAGLLPWRMRGVLAVALAAAALPLAAATRPPALAAEPAFVVLAGEMVAGGTLGLAVAAILAAAAWAGRLLGSVSGLSWADDFTPDAADDQTGSARLAWWLGVGGFLAAGGHLAVIGGLVDSVRSLPIGTIFAAGGSEAAGLTAMLVRLPVPALDVTLAVAAAALAAVCAFHVGAAVCLQTVRFTPGQGMLQGLAAVVALAAVIAGAEAWCGGYGTLARGHVEQTLRLETAPGR
jgi:flagellar biosynthesis protein FliR